MLTGEMIKLDVETCDTVGRNKSKKNRHNVDRGDYERLRHDARTASASANASCSKQSDHRRPPDRNNSFRRSTPTCVCLAPSSRRMLDFRQFNFGQFDFGQLAEVEIGQSRNWPKSKLAEVEKKAGRSRNWPKSTALSSRRPKTCKTTSFCTTSPPRSSLSSSTPLGSWSRSQRWKRSASVAPDRKFDVVFNSALHTVTEGVPGRSV